MDVLYKNTYKTDEVESNEFCVLLHGLFGSSTNLLSLAKAISTTYKPLVYDLPNHGFSPTLSPCNFVEMAKMLDATIVSECGDVPIHILGHSLGGKLAMVYSLLFPDKVKSLVIMDIAPVTYPPYHKEVIKGLLEVEEKKPNDRKEIAKILAQYTDTEQTAAFLAKSFVFENNVYAGSQIRLQEIIKEYDVLRSFPTEEMEGKLYKKPTLCLVAEETEYFEESYMKEIDKYFPSWEFETISNSGHNIHIDNPEETKEFILDFYQQQK